MSSHRVFAVLYDRLTAHSETKGVARKRAELIGSLRGRVVDIGAGTGLNIAHYREADHLTLIEPNDAMRKRLAEKLNVVQPPFPVEVLSLAVGPQRLPWDDASVDAIVTTFVLCSVRDVPQTLAEVTRVLRPGGHLVVIEHVRSTDWGRGVQRLLTPLQARVACGCHLDRNTRSALRSSGLDVQGVEDWRIPGTLGLLSSGIAGIARRPEEV